MIENIAIWSPAILQKSLKFKIAIYLKKIKNNTKWRRQIIV